MRDMHDLSFFNGSMPEYVPAIAPDLMKFSNQTQPEHPGTSITMSANFTQTAAFIWSVADLLRGDFKQSQYGRIILPFTLLRRLECVLQASKAALLAEVQRIAPRHLPQDAQVEYHGYFQ